MRYVIEAMRPILVDSLSTLVFFLLLWTTQNFVLATAAGIAAGLIEVAIRLVRRKSVGTLAWVSLGLVVIMGSASIFTQQPLFVMLKPTIAYLLVGAVMLKRGWMYEYVPQAARQYLSVEDVAPWGYAWAGLMLATAAVNLALAMMLDPLAWSAWFSVFTLGSKFVLFNVTFVAIRNKVRKARAAQAPALA